MPSEEQLGLLITSPVAYVLAFVLGALWGSFGNVCIYRMPPTDEHPKGRSVSVPGSHCSVCKSPVRWYDNVPLLSYLWLKGQCRDCGTHFSARYLLVEGATAILFVAVYHLVVGITFTELSPGKQLLTAGVYMAFVWVLVVITFIDLDHMLILDRITYPAIPIFYGLGLALGADYRTGLIGAAVGYLGVRLIADGYRLLTKREGMGYGDGKLLALIGALFGWQGVFFSLFGGSVIGTVITLPLLFFYGRAEDDEADVEADLEAGAGEGNSAADEELEEGDFEIGEGMQLAVPFGPFIAAAALVYLFLQPFLRLRFHLLWS